MLTPLNEIVSLNAQTIAAIDEFHACSEANLHTWEHVQYLDMNLDLTDRSEFDLALEKAELQWNECSRVRMETDTLVQTNGKKMFEYWKSGQHMGELAEALFPNSIKDQAKFLGDFFTILVDATPIGVTESYTKFVFNSEID